MQAYQFDHTTHEYLREIACQLDPLETERAGYPVYLTPIDSTRIAPPDEQTGYVRVFEGYWQQVEDHRGTLYWLSDEHHDDPPHEMKELGPLPEGATTTRPDYTDSELADAVRRERDTRLNEVEWRVDRYRDQRDSGVITDDTPAQYQAILTYMQALRDVPEQSGFPRNVVWPVAPNLG